MLRAWHRWPLPEARQGSPSDVHQGLCISKWQWFLECSPGAFPTRKVLDQLWLQKRIDFSFYSGLGAVGLAQVATTRSQAGVSGVHQGLSERYLATSASPSGSDQLWLQKRFAFHFIVALRAVGLAQVATTRSQAGVFTRVFPHLKGRFFIL